MERQRIELFSKLFFVDNQVRILKKYLKILFNNIKNRQSNSRFNERLAELVNQLNSAYLKKSLAVFIFFLILPKIN